MLLRTRPSEITPAAATAAGSSSCVGQFDPVGSDYTVETGPDPTNAARAWWNFQHSISYDGNINDLDGLTFADVLLGAPAQTATIGG